MKQNQLLQFGSMGIMLAVSILSSCKKDAALQPTTSQQALKNTRSGMTPGFADNNTVMYWNDKANLVLSVGMTQPTRSRLFAIIEIAVHDALNSIRPKYETYALKNEREQFASPDAAVASAAYSAIKGLNLQGAFPLDDWYNESLSGIPDGEQKSRGIALGTLAAEAIINQRSNDGIGQVIPASPFPANGTTPGAYRQTNMPDLRFVPNWGIVMQPWVITSNDQFRPAGPFTVSSAGYAQDFNEVKTKGARVNAERTAAEEELARFWADNRPSVIWNNVARAIVTGKKIDAWKTARFFALVHTAIADGFISDLESAYHFYYWRPETAVHQGDNDNNATTTADLNWLPFLNEGGPWVSPPVPEYPSGYALTGGIVAQIVESELGAGDKSFEITSATLPGTTLTYTSVAQAARDNAVAKIYAGWDFRKSVLDGEQMGRQIAGYVVSHAFRPAD